MKPSGPYFPRPDFEQCLLYLPDTGTSAAGTGLGPAWTTHANATVSHPAPASGFTTEWRRTRFTSTANSNIHLGPYFANSDLCCAFRGGSSPRGGFYFNALVRVNAIPATSIRFFAGLSAQTGTGLCTSNTVPANSIGIWCDDTDAASLSFVSTDGSANANKQALSSAVTLTAGVLYRIELFCYPAQSTVLSVIRNVGADTVLAETSTAGGASLYIPSSTAMMAPQVGLGNAANATGGDTDLDVYSIYLRPNLKLVQQGAP